VRATRLAEALHGAYVAPGDRDPEPERPARGTRPLRRWVLSTPSPGDPESFARKAIALRALRGAAAGSQLVDSLTGEVVAEAGS
jgi:DNA excision repair protein ERCC-4/Fanconi anemia group M protein